ncbi:pectate lyase-like adhesive domain-containing protein [Streptococcus sp. E17BB]|uniref:GA-like domain-containing protein n=1 Tax=Streptococcus sp. E17BB TaxID=3278714 RepID=UPI00359D9AFD
MDRVSKEKIRHLKAELKRRRLAEPLVKKRHKMYKSKGRWLVASILFLSIGAAGGTTVTHAEEVQNSQPKVVEENTGLGDPTSDGIPDLQSESLTETSPAQKDESLKSTIETPVESMPKGDSVETPESRQKIVESASTNTEDSTSEKTSLDESEKNAEKEKGELTKETTADDKGTKESSDKKEVETPKTTSPDEEKIEKEFKTGIDNEEPSVLVDKSEEVDDLIRSSAMLTRSALDNRDGLNKIDVSTADEFAEALIKGDYDTINITSDIDFWRATKYKTGNATVFRTVKSRPVQILGNNHRVNLAGTSWVVSAHTAIRDAKIWGTSYFGIFGDYKPNNSTAVSYENVDYTGAQFAYYYADQVLSGNNTITIVKNYEYGGEIYTTEGLGYHQAFEMLGKANVIFTEGSNTTIKAQSNEGTNYGIVTGVISLAQGNLTVSEGATVNVENQDGGRGGINFHGHDQKLIVKKDANLFVKRGSSNTPYDYAASSNIYFETRGQIFIGENAKVELTQPQTGNVWHSAGIWFEDGETKTILDKNAKLTINGVKTSKSGDAAEAYFSREKNTLDIGEGATVTMSASDGVFEVRSKGSVVNVHRGGKLDVLTTGNASKSVNNAAIKVKDGSIYVYEGGTLNARVEGASADAKGKPTYGIYNDGGTIVFAKGSKGVVSTDSSKATAYYSEGTDGKLIVFQPESVVFENKNGVLAPFESYGLTISLEKGRVIVGDKTSTPVSKADVKVSQKGKTILIQNISQASESVPALKGATKAPEEVFTRIPVNSRVEFRAALPGEVSISIDNKDSITDKTVKITGTATPNAWVTLTDLEGNVLRKNLPNTYILENAYIPDNRYVTKADERGQWSIDLVSPLSNDQVIVAEDSIGWKVARDVAYVHNTQVPEDIESIKQTKDAAQDLYTNGKDGLSYKTDFNNQKLDIVKHAVEDALAAKEEYDTAVENALKLAKEYLAKMSDASAAREAGSLEGEKESIREAKKALEDYKNELIELEDSARDISNKLKEANAAYNAMKPDESSIKAKAKAEAEELVKKAEEAGKAAQAKQAEAEKALDEANKDGLITPAEKAAIEEANKAIEDANAATEKAKGAAQAAVNALPDEDKGDLPGRLEAIKPATTVQVPKVNDENGNGVDDAKEAADKAKAKKPGYKDVIDYGTTYINQTGYNTLYSSSGKRLSRSVENELPQTGSEDSSTLDSIGILLASLGLTGLVASRRKKREE